MKMKMKKIVSILLTVLMLSQCLAFTAFAETVVADPDPSAYTKDLITIKYSTGYSLTKYSPYFLLWNSKDNNDKNFYCKADWFKSNNVINYDLFYMNSIAKNASDTSCWVILANQKMPYQSFNDTYEGILVLDGEEGKTAKAPGTAISYQNPLYGAVNNPLNRGLEICYDLYVPDHTNFTFPSTFPEDYNVMTGKGESYLGGFSHNDVQTADVGVSVLDSVDAAQHENKPFEYNGTYFGSVGTWQRIKIEYKTNDGVMKQKVSYETTRDSGTYTAIGDWTDSACSCGTCNGSAPNGVDKINPYKTSGNTILLHELNVKWIDRPSILSTTLSGDLVNTAEELSFDINFSQPIADSQESKVEIGELVYDTDFTVAKKEGFESVYTVTIPANKLDFNTVYTVDASKVESVTGLLAEGASATFTTATDPSLVQVTPVYTETNGGLDWKQSNEITLNFSDDVNVESSDITLKYKNGATVDAPVIVETVDADTVNVTVGQLDAWRDYKLEIASDVLVDTSKTLANPIVNFTTAHSDIYELDFNKEGSINGLTYDDRTDEKDLDKIAFSNSTSTSNGISYYSHSPSGKSVKYILTTKSIGKPVSLQYYLQADQNAAPATGVYLGFFSWDNWGGITQTGSNVGRMNNTHLYGGASENYSSYAHGNNFVDYKQIYSIENDGTRSMSHYYMNGTDGYTELGDATICRNNKGVAYNSTTNYDYKDSTFECITVYNHNSNTANGPYNFARLVISTKPQADIMKSVVNTDDNTVTLAFGKDLDLADNAAATAAIKVKNGDTEIGSSVEKVNANTYKITISDTLEAGQSYTIDMSGVKSTDGILGAENFEFTATEPEIYATGLTISGKSAHVTVKNNKDSGNASFTIIIAAYNPTSKMMEFIDYLEVNDLAAGATCNYNGTEHATATINDNITNGSILKAMVWQGGIQDAKPLIKSVSETYSVAE